MQSSAKDVDAYLDDVPDERKASLEKLRSLCVSELRGYEECIDYGMPGYKKDGIAFASQKNYISIYVLKQDVLADYRDELAVT